MRNLILLVLVAALLAGLALGRGDDLADTPRALGGLLPAGQGWLGDPRALALGFVLGVLARSIVRVPWLQLPSLLAAWLFDRRNVFGRIALCCGFGAVLLFY